MSRTTLTSTLLLLTIPSLAIAAPREKTEAAVPDESAPRAGAPAPTDAPVHLEEPIRVPIVEGAGGPHVGHHTAPHHGALVPVGESLIHLEFVLEPKTGLLTLYVLDAEAQKPADLNQDMVVLNGEYPIVLFAADRDERSPSAPRGSSRFVVQYRRLEGVEHFQGQVEWVKVGQQAYRGISFTYPQGTEDAK